MIHKYQGQLRLRKKAFAFLWAVIFLFSCGDEYLVDSSQGGEKTFPMKGRSATEQGSLEAMGISLEEGAQEKEALSKEEKQARFKEKLSSDTAKEAFDLVLEKRTAIKASIEALCSPSSEVISIKDEVEAIKEDEEKSKDEKISEIKTLLEESKEVLEQGEKDHFSCLLEKKDEIGPLIVERRALKFYCGLPFKKHHKKHHGKKKFAHKKGFGLIKSFLKEEKKSHKFDKLEFIEEKLLSEDCQNLLSR